MKLERTTNTRRTNEEIDNLIFNALMTYKSSDIIKVNKIYKDTGINYQTLNKRLPDILDKIRNKTI